MGWEENKPLKPSLTCCLFCASEDVQAHKSQHFTQHCEVQIQLQFPGCQRFYWVFFYGWSSPKRATLSKILFLTSEVKVTIIFRVACRSEWGKRTLQSSLQHFFLKNSTTISQLHVSPCGYRFQVQQHTEVCKSQQLIFSLTYQSHLVIYYDFAISVWSDSPLP